MTNEDLHLRERDERAAIALIRRAEQAERNAEEWVRLGWDAIEKGDPVVGVNRLKAAREELKHAFVDIDKWMERHSG